MKCIHCNYVWESRKERPKACPRCKRRFDYPNFLFVQSINKINRELKIK